MGAYLSHPITEKSSSDNRDNRLKCGASSMQGWRVSQEDAHNCILDFEKEASLFAVYDGHGGKEVAEFAADKLPDIIKNIENFKKGNYAEALKDAFLEFDKMLVLPEVVEKLKIIANDKKEGTTEDDMEDENIGDLREEAAMPLEQLMAKYRKGRLGEKEDSPASPFLRGKATSSTADSSSSAVNVSSSSSSSGSAGKSVSSSSGGSSSSGEGSSNQDVSSSRSDEKANISSTCEEPCSSSSSSGHTRKSLEEKYCNGDVSTSQDDKEVNVVTNGECEKQAGADDGVSSSVDGRLEMIKTEVKKIKASLLNSLVSACDACSDDSSDTDESFAEGAGSSTDDDDVEGAEGNGEEDDDEDDEEEDEDDDDDDEEGEDEDDEFTMKMTDDLAGALKEGRLVHDGTVEYDNPDNQDDNDQDGIGPGFLIQALKKRTPGADSGCTAVVALVLKDRVLVANAGDSRCVACRDGQAIDLSVDHKPEDAVELARIVKAGGKVTSDGRVNGGLNLSRALGDHVYKKVETLPLEEQMISPLPDIQEIKVTNDIEFLILACDGIWNYMSSQEVVDFVKERLQKKPANISSICEELFDHCLAPNTMGDGTGCDNMTAVIVQFNQSESEGSGDSSKRRAEDDGKDIKENKRTKTDTPEAEKDKTETETSNLPSTAL